MLNVGIAGIGFMGMIHYLAYQKVRGARVRAICDERSERLAGDWRGIKGNFGPAGQMMDLSGISRYLKTEELIADPGIDAIDVCLPPGLHADVAIRALRAGKHVFCEKPIALSTGEADQMVKAARRAGKMLMIGHVLPFFPEFRFAYQTVVSGKYGKLRGARLKRIISDPTWLADFWNPATTGGPMIDLHIHDAHFIRLLCGMPRTVQSVGSMRGQVAELFDSQFLFDDSLMVSATSGAIPQQGRPFVHAYEIYLERATLAYDSGGLARDGSPAVPLTVLTNEGRVLRPKLTSTDPVDSFVAEIGEFVRCVRSGTPSAILDGQLARDALVICQRETQSLAKRRPVRV